MISNITSVNDDTVANFEKGEGENEGDNEGENEGEDDYNKIYISSETALKPQYTTQMFMHNLAFIREMHNYATKENIKMVLLTHHQPYIFNPKGMRSYAYMTDLTDLFDEQVILVAHGHTHEHRANTIKSTKIYSNPLGYPDQDCGFNRNEKISIM